MDAQGWWGVLLQGCLAAVVGGVVAALTAWAVVMATHRYERRLALVMEARGAAVRMFQLVAEYSSALDLAAHDPDAVLPTAQTRDWLVTATSVEIAMFSLEGGVGALLSQDLGDLRRSLEALHAAEPQARAEAIDAAKRRAQKLIEDLADWLMDGRHRASRPDEEPELPQ